MKTSLVRSLFVGAAMAVTMATAAHAEEFTINTLNMSPKHGLFQFEPRFLRIKPGDTVHFVAKDKGHDALSIPGMLPEGAKPFKGELNKDVTVTFTKEGVYGIQCKPHYGMGMVALIVVGDPSSNLEQAKAVKQPGKARKVFEDLFDQVSK
ncbi:MAG: pseudoazurin [Hyphomicrobiaceae bacterium]